MNKEINNFIWQKWVFKRAMSGGGLSQLRKYLTGSKTSLSLSILSVQIIRWSLPLVFVSFSIFPAKVQLALKFVVIVLTAQYSGTLIIWKLSQLTGEPYLKNVPFSPQIHYSKNLSLKLLQWLPTLATLGYESCDTTQSIYLFQNNGPSVKWAFHFE